MIAFGNAADGQLGLGGIEETAIYQARWNKHVKNRDIVAVGCGLKHTLLLLRDGRVLSCGSNEKGQLGQKESVTRPGLVSSLQDHVIVQVACGHHHSLALSDGGLVFSWGDGQYGQLGLGPDSMGPAFMPQKVTVSPSVEQPEEVVQIACGAHHNLALLRDGRVYSWGENNHHQLGIDSGQESFLSAPTLITSLSSVPIHYMSSGFGHNIVVTRGGVALAWGRNSYGQLGIGTTSDQITPCHMAVLLNRGKVVKYAACGDEHSLILTSDGEVYSCGLNQHGQLGLGSTSNKDLPTLVKALGNSVCQVTCGRMHSAALSYPAGDVFLFGQAGNGQLGVRTSKFLPIPTGVSLGDPPEGQMTDEVMEQLREAIEKEELSDKIEGFSKKLKQEIPREGSSVDPPSSHSSSGLARVAMEPVHLEYAPRQVFCGGDQTFVLVDIKTTMNSLEASNMWQVHKSPHPVDLRSACMYRTPLYMTRDYLLATKCEGQQLGASRMLEVEKVFSSPTLLSGSFTPSSSEVPVSEHHPGVRLADLQEILELLKQETTAVPKRQVPMATSGSSGHLAESSVHDTEAVGRTIEQALEHSLLPSLTMAPCWLEGLRCLLVAPFWFKGKPKVRKELLLEYVRRILKLTKQDREVLAKWYFKLSTSYAEAVWSLIKYYMRSTIASAFTRTNTSPDPETHYQLLKTDEENVELCLRFARDLHKVNSTLDDSGISCDVWHISELTEFVDIPNDYITFLQNKPTPHIVWCEYPFLLDARAKGVIVQVDNIFSMKLAVTQAYTHNFHRLFTGQIVADMSPDSFVLLVDRKNLVDSTVIQLGQSRENFKKPLRVQFLDEEGEDVGGVAKEFFMLLSQRILNPDFGMFMEDEESHLYWFRDGELFYEKLDYYNIIGILCGLAIYNSIIVYLPFPMALYKKLLDRNTNFKDFKQIFPSTAKGIEELLQYDGDDFEDNFHLNFTITRHVLGEVVVKELVTNGKLKNVTKENREHYCECYINYFLKTSIHEQFKAFRDGFMRVCEGKVLKMLDPEDLMSLVVGDQVQDWEEMKQNTLYKNGYSADSRVIQCFWEVFNEFSKEQKNKFLVFLTGTDRIPIEGFKHMKVIIQKMDGGPKCERLPVAHTCFNILDLPPYPSKQMMRDKLLQAMNFTSGFGLI